MLTEDSHRREDQTSRKHRRDSGRRWQKLLSTAIALGAVVCAGVVVVSNVEHNGTSTSARQTAITAKKPTAISMKTSVVNPPKSWKLTLDSDFSGSTLNPNIWATCYWWGGSEGCTNYGSSNDEKEWYLPSQAKVSGGVLRLTALPERTAGFNSHGKPEEYACRSGMVTTLPGYSFKYGEVQMVAKLPPGHGLWSAFWLAATNKKWPPEIDIMEHWNAAPNTKSYLHPVSGPRQGGVVATVATSLFKQWNTFTLKWTRTSLTWYINNYEVLSTTTDVPQQAMYIVANLADTSTIPGSCNGTMLIKSIKVWQP